MSLPIFFPRFPRRTATAWPTVRGSRCFSHCSSCCNPVNLLPSNPFGTCSLDGVTIVENLVQYICLFWTDFTHLLATLRRTMSEDYNHEKWHEENTDRLSSKREETAHESLRPTRTSTSTRKESCPSKLIDFYPKSRLLQNFRSVVVFSVSFPPPSHDCQLGCQRVAVNQEGAFTGCGERSGAVEAKL